MLAPLVKARKGFHTDVARWAERQGFDTLYVDGKLVRVSNFRKFERFKEHTIDVVVGVIDAQANPQGAQSRAARAPDRPRNGASPRYKKSPHGHEHRDELSRVAGALSKNSIRVCSPSTRPTAPAKNAVGSAKFGTTSLQTGNEDNGESVLENELAAERESEWIDED